MSVFAIDGRGSGGLNRVRTDTEHPETVVLRHAVGYDLTYWDRQIEALRDDYPSLLSTCPAMAVLSANLETGLSKRLRR